MSDTKEPVQSTPLDPSRQLHERLLAGDVTASAEIATTFLDPLVERMRARYHWLDDPHLSQSAAVDAVDGYLRRPETYNPDKGSLATYLYLAAVGDLKNALTKLGRERRAQGGKRVVELDTPGAEYLVGDDDGLSVEEQVDVLLSPIWAKLSELLPDPIDHEIVRLMMDNVRDTKVFAQILGITDLSPDDQAQEVKRHKDRLKKHLQRNLRLPSENDD